MFNFLKKESRGFVAPVTGKCIPIEEVADEVFSAKMLGEGFAVKPEGDIVVAPVSGEIVMLPDSRHAFGMITKTGVEVLVHIGLETVGLNGQGFTALAKAGDRVKAGTPVIRFDRRFMESKGLDLTTIVVFTAGYNKEVRLVCNGRNVTAGDMVME